jgi:hypothetical protein
MVKIAYLPDPVKIRKKPPKPGVRQRLQAESEMQFVQVCLVARSLLDVHVVYVCSLCGYAYLWKLEGCM